MIDATPPFLAFPDRRQSGRFPVIDATGAVVARISTSWRGTTFSANDADGRLLCAASTGCWGLSPTWRATGPDARALLSVTRRWMRSSAAVHLERGGDFMVHGSAWRRDFVVTDQAGTPVLTAVPRTSALSFRPHDYAVTQTRTAFQLPEIVALVQIWRMVRKDEAAAATGATAATAATST